jgi:hypothetical protein
MDPTTVTQVGPTSTITSPFPGSPRRAIILYISYLIVLILLLSFASIFFTQTSTLLLKPSPTSTPTPLQTVSTGLFQDSIILAYDYPDMFDNSGLSRFTAVDPRNTYKDQLIYKLDNSRDIILSMKRSPNRTKLAFGFFKIGAGSWACLLPDPNLE